MRVHLSVEAKRIVLSAAWSPDLAGLCKQIAGANFRNESKTWTYPKNLTTLRELRRVFGTALAPDRETLRYARMERARERKLRHIGRRYDAELVRVPTSAPRLAAAMADRTYQRAGARFGAVAGSFLLADEPGLGKTATALAALIESDAWHGDHLVSAPKASLDSVWRRQINLWTPDAQVVSMPEGRKEREAALNLFWELDEPRFLIINLAMIRRLYEHICLDCEIWFEDVKRGKAEFPPEHHLEEHDPRRKRRKIRNEDWPEILNHHWESVILDESHEALAAYTPANTTQQTAGLLDLKAERKYALTGTPLRGRETRIWGTLDWLGHRTGGYWAWVDTFFEVGSNGFAKVVHGLDPAMAPEFYRSLDRFVLRRTRAEVRPDLPLGQRMDILVDMTPKHRLQYKEFEEMGETRLASGLVEGQGTLSELTRLKQLAFGIWTGGKKLQPTGESAKIEWTMQFLRERGIIGKKTQDWFPEPGSAYKYVVASQFTEIIDACRRVLDKAGIATMQITGAITGKRRNDAASRFQSDDREIRVCLIQTQTGGVSIELDAWCDEMVILDETWVADAQVQLEGRINNRSGRVAPRTWWYVRMADTIEQSIAEGNWMQHDLQHKLLDGRRGIETALHLIRKEAP